MLHLMRSRGMGLLVTGTLLVLVGCLPVEESQEGTSEETPSFFEQVLSSAPRIPVAAESFTEIEPNDLFSSASPILFENSVDLIGTIASGSATLDRDLYELGPASAGDRIQATFTINNGRDLVFGLFDDQLRLLAYIDQSSYATGPREIDLVLREATEALYAMAATRSSSSQGRAYTTNFSIEPGTSIPAYHPQVVVLNFSGADNVRIGNRVPVNVPPFDVANIDSRFAGQTDLLIELLLELVREDYAGLSVEIYADDDPNLPAGEHTVLYFGTSDPGLLGLADNIDPFNADATQSAILYTDTFALFNPLVYDLYDHAQVLANVASHEAGHLLGLRHTTDPDGIMDITATARQMLQDQWFKKSPLHASVGPMGYQDAAAMLAWTVGGELIPRSPAKRANQLKPSDVGGDPDDFIVPRHLLSSCSEHDHEPH